MAESNGDTNSKIVPIMLCDRTVGIVRNWHELLKLWNEARTYKQMQALLLEGYDVPLGHRAYGEPDYDQADRHEFYFNVANGWADCSLLKTLADGDWSYVINGVERTHREVRQMVAETAFKQLCQNFFKKLAEAPVRDDRRRFESKWTEVIASEQLLQVIMNFFSPEGISIGLSGERIAVVNLNHRDHQRHPLEKHARDFLIKLQEFLWEWEETKIHTYTSDSEETKQRNIATHARNVAMRAWVDVAKVWMVEVLVGLDKLERLWGICGPRQDQFIELDKACLEKLEEVALRSSFSEFYHPVRKQQRVATVNEAYLAGSMAARFLMEYNAKRIEWRRLRLIQRLEWRREASNERKRKRLKAIEKAEAARIEAERTLQELNAPASK
jgi:hypothetical protein